MAKNNLEVALSPSGHQYDKDLARVKIKVSPSLQALIANQLEFIEIVEICNPENHIFLEQHKAELFQLEEEISQAFADYILKKERARVKREQKKNELASAPILEMEETFSNINTGNTAAPQTNDLPWSDEPLADHSASYHDDNEREQLSYDPLAELDKMAANLSPGLPSAKYTTATAPVEKKVDVDVRRIAIGASVKALVDFLNRPLTEEEIQTIEKQVDSYLN